ncbi:MAG: 50S ribosomal protein L34e [Candidatus Nanoarchaeia archaeon]
MREQKSRKHRKIRVVTPGGKTKIIYKKKKPSKAQCAKCGSILHGVPSQRVYKIKRMPKTKKRPERPYGGVLCSKCTRELMVEKARSMYKEEKKEEE